MKSVLFIFSGIVLLIAIVLLAVPDRRERTVTTGDRTENESGSDAAMNGQPLRLPLVSPKIVVRKRVRRLTLYAKGRAVRRYRIGLGFSPVGDKRREGDGKTPEGRFYICQKNPVSSYYLSLGLSYPGIDDAKRGLRDGAITREEHDRIVDAIRAKDIPPWNTKLGGEVFIHGHGSQRDWTWGCIALDDVPMKELFDVVPLGTEVVIEP